MALLSAFFPANKLVSLESTAADNTTIFLEIDATPSEGHQRSSTVTNFPVESGSSISDHVVRQNDRLDLQCVVSSNPFELITTARQVFDIEQIRNPISRIEKAKRLIRELGTVGKMLQSNESRVENVYRYLTELHKNANPIRIVTDLELYENMIMTRLDITRNTQTGGTLEFNATFERIQVVKNQLVISSFEKSVSDDVAESAKKSSDLGKQGITDPSDSIKNKGSSILVKITEYL